MPFPLYRPRRLRESPLLRKMVRETQLRVQHLVYPHRAGRYRTLGVFHPGPQRVFQPEVNRIAGEIALKEGDRTAAENYLKQAADLNTIDSELARTVLVSVAAPAASR